MMRCVYLHRDRSGCLRFRRVVGCSAGWTVAAILLSLSVAPAWPQSKPVDPYSYAPYSATANPRITAKFGADALPAINVLRKAAALKIARDPTCNRVSTSELSDSRSAKPDAWVFVVDCDNGRRFFVTKAELEKDSSPEDGRRSVRPAT